MRSAPMRARRRVRRYAAAGRCRHLMPNPGKKPCWGLHSHAAVRRVGALVDPGGWPGAERPSAGRGRAAYPSRGDGGLPAGSAPAIRIPEKIPLARQGCQPGRREPGPKKNPPGGSPGGQGGLQDATWIQCRREGAGAWVRPGRDARVGTARRWREPRHGKRVQSRRKTSRPSSAPTRITSPGENRPASRSWARGFSMRAWIARLSGRAPNTGSKPTTAS